MFTSTALNPAQLEAVTAPDGPVLVIAGAGSGKTRTIVHRIAWLVTQGVPPSAMLLLTFTRKASQEMLHRATELLGHTLENVHGGTFHGVAFSILRQYKPTWATGSITVMDGADAVAALQHCKKNLPLIQTDRSFPKVQTILNIFSKARNKETNILSILKQDAPHMLMHVEALDTLSHSYTEYKKTYNLLDYDDLLFELETLLLSQVSSEKNEESLSSILQKRYQYIMVDEYQDTNRVQARLIRLIAGAQGNTMVVGDDAQSIYGFRGADVRNILDFPQLFPGAKIIRLEENYRSTQPILDVANTILESSPEAFHKRLFTNNKTDNTHKVRLTRSLSDLTQANIISARIEDLLTTYSPKDIAILFRAGYQSYHIEIALSKCGIPFRKYGGLRYTEAAHIKDILAFVRLTINPLDMPSFLRIASLSKGVGPKTAQKIYQVAAQGDSHALLKACSKFPGLFASLECIERLRNTAHTPRELLEETVVHYTPSLMLQFPEDWPRRQQGIEELVHIASSYNDTEQFIADLSLETPEETSSEEEAIVLSTIHSAKGLEWDAVIILDLVEGRFPSKHSLVKQEDFEEERRLMYVACTRAREYLELSVPMTLYSKQYGGNEPAVPSPFVQILPEGTLEEWQEGYSGRITKKNSHVQEVLLHQKKVTHPIQKNPNSYSFCHHKIFGRGKIIEHISSDKCRVNFPGFGPKVILTEYLTLEEESS